MAGTQIEPGDRSTFSKTVGESDVYLFAGISGDLGPNHVNAEYMRTTPYGERIAHGALLLGYASTACTSLLDAKAVSGVSYGYDRIRFTAPVFIGDTVTVDYVCRDVDAAARRCYCDIEVRNQRGEICMVAVHVLALV